MAVSVAVAMTMVVVRVFIMRKAVVMAGHARSVPQMRLLVNAAVKVAASHHAAARCDGIAVPAHESGRTDHGALFGAGQRGGEAGRLHRAEIGGTVAVIALGRGFDTIRAQA